MYLKGAVQIEKLLEKKYNSSLVGFLQAAGVLVYCGLIAVFFFYMTKTAVQPGIVGIFLMLALFVFSAAVTGSLIFGYPAYLALVKNRIKEAFTILAYTLFYSLLIILLTIIAIVSFA
jgi:hypothetical protein